MKITIKEIVQRAGISTYMARQRVAKVPHTQTRATSRDPVVYEILDKYLSYLLKKPDTFDNLISIGEISIKSGISAPVIHNRFKRNGITPVAVCPKRHCNLYTNSKEVYKIAVTDCTGNPRRIKRHDVTSQDGANIIKMEKEKQSWVGKYGCFVTPDGQEYAHGIITKVSMIACYIGDQMGHLKFLKLLEQPA